jgi:MarR family transcriptional regulator, organic hydroperoxide resistance regulator
MNLKTTSREDLLAQGSDARFRQMVYDLFTISTHMQSVRNHMASRIGISGPQYSILMAIAEMQNEIGVSVKRVAEHLHVSGAFVTAEAGKMLKLGYLEKRPNPEDRRGVRLTLSAKGTEETGLILPELCSINDVFFGGLDKNDFEGLADIAANMIAPAEEALRKTTGSE